MIPRFVTNMLIVKRLTFSLSIYNKMVFMDLTCGLYFFGVFQIIHTTLNWWGEVN
jgi:hypothetical protein